MMQNGGNHAKVNRVSPQPASIWGENVDKIYSTWNPGNTIDTKNGLLIIPMEWDNRKSFSFC
jgi:hypothetical protein